MPRAWHALACCVRRKRLSCPHAGRFEWCTFNVECVSVWQETAASLCTRMKNHRRRCSRHRHPSTTLFPDPVKLCTVCTRRIFGELVKCIRIRIACTCNQCRWQKPSPTAVPCILTFADAAVAVRLHHRQAYFPENSIYTFHRALNRSAAPHDRGMSNTSFRFR